MSYNDSEVKVPFFVEEDKSHPWIFSLSNNLVELKHDHRKPDRYPDKITFYGGTATNEGSAEMQLFPADAATEQLIDYAAFNVWWVIMDETKFSYKHYLSLARLLRINNKHVFVLL